MDLRSPFHMRKQGGERGIFHAFWQARSESRNKHLSDIIQGSSGNTNLLSVYKGLETVSRALTMLSISFNPHHKPVNGWRLVHR